MTQSVYQQHQSSQANRQRPLGDIEAIAKREAGTQILSAFSHIEYETLNTKVRAGLFAKTGILQRFLKDSR